MEVNLSYACAVANQMTIQILYIYWGARRERSSISFQVSGKQSMSVLQKEIHVNHTEVNAICIVIA